MGMLEIPGRQWFEDGGKEYPLKAEVSAGPQVRACTDHVRILVVKPVSKFRRHQESVRKSLCI